MQMQRIHAAVAERFPNEKGVIHPSLGKMAVHDNIHIPYSLVPRLAAGQAHRRHESVHAVYAQDGLAGLGAHEGGLQARLRVKGLPNHRAIARPHAVEQLINDNPNAFGGQVGGRLRRRRRGQRRRSRRQYGAYEKTHRTKIAPDRTARNSPQEIARLATSGRFGEAPERRKGYLVLTPLRSKAVTTRHAADRQTITGNVGRPEGAKPPTGSCAPGHPHQKPAGHPGSARALYVSGQRTGGT